MQAANKARDGLAKHTRFQTTAASKFLKRVQTSAANTGNSKTSLSCRRTVPDRNLTLNLAGRCEDGSNVSLVLKEVAEQAVLKCIGKLHSIETVYLEIDLKNKNEGPSENFLLSEARTVPITVLRSSVGQMALKNISYLVADG